MRKGFTLIELLIVIAIIAVLAVAFLPGVLNAPAKARDAQRIEDVNKIAKFLSLQYAVNGKTFESSEISSTQTVQAANPAGVLIKTNLADFGGVFPKDPDSNNCITIAGSCKFKGHYVIKKHAAPYAFAVVANVELDENGNAANWESTTIGDSGDVYVVLIQK